MRWFALIDDDIPIISIDRWGPNGWKFITACAFAYPMQPTASEMTQMQTFLVSMQYVLPCHFCREHYARNVRTLTNVSLATRKTLLQWMNDTRNAINRTAGKPEVTFDEMLRASLTGCKHRAYITITKQQIRNVIYVVLLIILLLWVSDALFRD